MRRQGKIDSIVMRGRRDLKLLQPLRGLGRQLFSVVGKALLEVIALRPHHRVDRIEMSGDASVELVGVGPKTVYDVVPAFTDKTIQRLEIFAHALGLLRYGLHEANGALVDDMVKGGDPLAERLMNAARSVRRCGCGGDGKGRETLVDLRRFRVQRRHGSSRRRLDLRLGEGALGGDRADKATRR